MTSSCSSSRPGPSGWSSARQRQKPRPQVLPSPPQKKERRQSDSHTGLGERETSSSPYTYHRAADSHPGDAGPDAFRSEQANDRGRHSTLPWGGGGHRYSAEGFEFPQPG